MKPWQGCSRRFALVLCCSLIAAAVVVGPAAAQETLGEYRLGPRDVLEIKVLEIPELNVDRRVSDQGAIDLPMVGAFPVSGLTAAEVKERLEVTLRSRYVNHANVSIVIKDYANKPVSIVGAVQKPGFLNVSGKWDLLQAISAAGGLSPNAGRRIYVIRRNPNGLSETLEISVDDLMTKASGTWNVAIYPSDVVNIPVKTIVKVYVLGEVRTPGAHEFSSDDRLSVLSVIAKAGGLTERAAKKVLIKRRDIAGKEIQIFADYNRIVSGRAPDAEIKPDDVVVINASFF